MSEKPLSDLVDERGASEVARLFGVTPVAIQKAVDADRKITVHVDGSNIVEAFEVKPYPSPSHQKVSPTVSAEAPSAP